MSKTVVQQIASSAQLDALIAGTAVVVVDFYADWCGPCKTIAPLYEQLAAQLTRPAKMAFCKVNTEQQAAIAQTHGISAMPTFIVFKHTHEVARIRGADPAQLATAVRRLAAEADGPASASAASSSSSTAGFGAAAGAGSAAAGSSGSWRGVAALPRGYTDVTDQVDVRGLDMLNGDSAFGGARALFDAGRPSGLGGGASSGGKAAAAGAAAGRGSRDWVESDTDEQLMLYVPFQATLKIHTLHITSLAGRPGAGGDDDDDDDAPVRPREVRLYVNRAHVLGFEEADGVPATQTVELSASDWDAATGTAAVPLRFVKFQKCSSLVLFVVSGEGDGERVRVDRLRFVGESGEKREMGRLEKVGDEQE